MFRNRVRKPIRLCHSQKFLQAQTYKLTSLQSLGDNLLFPKPSLLVFSPVNLGQCLIIINIETDIVGSILVTFGRNRSELTCEI